MNDGYLSGKVALVTGGSRRIGRGIALALARAGAGIAVNYCQDRAAAEATVTAIQVIGRNTAAFQADVADYEAVKAMVARTVKGLGKLDILVCNAGIMPGGPLADFDIGEMHRMMNTHVFGAFHCIKEAPPHVRQQPRSDI